MIALLASHERPSGREQWTSGSYLSDPLSSTDLQLVVFRQTQQICALHLQQVLQGGLADGHHFVLLVGPRLLYGAWCGPRV